MSAADVRRWYVLAIYSWISAQQSLLWMTYSSVPSAGAAFLGCSPSTLVLLLDWGPIFFLVALPLAVWMLRWREGMRWSILASAGLCASAALLRTVPYAIWREDAPLWTVHVAQILNASAAPFVVVSPSYLSTLWFAGSERNFATAVANVANALGRAVGFFLGPALVHHADDMLTLLWLEVGVTALPLICAIIHMPNEPPEPPTKVAALERAERLGLDAGAWSLSSERPFMSLTTPSDEVADIGDEVADSLVDRRPSATNKATSPWPAIAEMLGLLLQPRVLLVCVAGGVQMAVYGAWSGQLPSVLTATAASASSSSASLTAWQAGVIGCVNTLAGILSGLGAGVLTDRPAWMRRLRTVLIIVSALSTALFVLAALGTGPWAVLALARYEALVATCTLAGLLRGGLDPLFFELVAEAAHPTSAGVAGGALTLWYHGVLAIVLALPVSALSIGLFPAMAASTLVCGVLLALPVSIVYTRRDIDEVPS